MTEQHTDRLRTHARWRAGWQPGRSSYAWLLSFAGEPGMRRLVNSYQYALHELPGFDLVPLEWLHLLVQEAGFTDEIPQEQADALAAAARDRLAGAAPLRLEFRPAHVLAESLALPATPEAPLDELRAALRQAVADVRGEQAVPPAPDEADRHVNIAHSTADGPSAFAAAILGATATEPTTAEIRSVSFVSLNRDHSSIEWQTVAEIPLGG